LDAQQEACSLPQASVQQEPAAESLVSRIQAFASVPSFPLQHDISDLPFLASCLQQAISFMSFMSMALPSLDILSQQAQEAEAVAGLSVVGVFAEGSADCAHEIVAKVRINASVVIFINFSKLFVQARARGAEVQV
jgi:hypothetical protein